MNARGRAQSERLRQDLQAFRFEWCAVSPMRRCLETREIVAPDAPFDIEDVLREVRFGDWEGKSAEWLERHVPELVAQRRRDPVSFRPPGGESFADIAPRLQPFAQKLRRHGDVLVIAHRGTLGVLERLLRGLPLESRDVVPLEPAEFSVVHTN